MAQSIAELVGLIELGLGCFESKHNAEFNGGLDPRFAYGGCAIAFGINAASATVKNSYRVYSALGNFLNAASTNYKLYAEVTSIRDTRTFATRRIDISQYSNGEDRKTRPIVFMVVDFMIPESVSLITYSTLSTIQYSSPAKSMSQNDLERAAKEKSVPDKVFEAMKRRFGNMEKYVERRYCPEGTDAQTFNEMAPELPTTQDKLAVTDKRSLWWFRSRKSGKSYTENLMTLVYTLDAGSPFSPVTFNRINIRDIGACASLDFAIRILVNDFDISQWHLREEKSVAAGAGRTFQDCHIKDESGRIIASMTEQCILRPKKQKL